METQELSKAGQVNLADSSDVEPLTRPDISQGFPDTNNPVPVEDANTVVKPSGVPVVEETPPLGTETPPAAEEPSRAVTERLKQQNAQQAKLLASLGIDPLSDLGEQLEKGLITEEMLRAHVASKYQTPAAQTPEAQAPVNDPVATALAEQTAAKAAYDKEVQETGGVSLDTNNRLRDSDLALNEARLSNLTHQITADKQVKQVNESVEAVLSVARTNPEFAKMEAPLQKATEQVSVALTGMLADQKSRTMGIDPTTLNAQQYGYFAGEANKTLNDLAEFYRNLGRNEVRAGFTPPSNQLTSNPLPTVVPADNSGSPAPVANPYTRVNVQNHKEAAQNFARQNRQVI